MTRSNTSKLEPFDLEIESNLRNLVETKLSPKNEAKETMENQAGVAEANRSLMDYALPLLTRTTLSIRRL